MWNAEWLRAYDSLRVIARRYDEAIQTISIQINGNEQKADCVSGRPFLWHFPILFLFLHLLLEPAVWCFLGIIILY